jgi:hypothetical protein
MKKKHAEKWIIRNDRNGTYLNTFYYRDEMEDFINRPFFADKVIIIEYYYNDELIIKYRRIW